MYPQFERRGASIDGPRPEFTRHRHHHPHHPHHHPDAPFDPRGHGGRGRGRGFGRGRGRAQRGDVRTATLILLAEQPMHGYQLMQAIAERTNGQWKPSPGAIYPTLSQLQDEGLVDVTNEGGRKLANLTEAGRTYLAEAAETLGDPFAEFAGFHPSAALRPAIEELVSAVRQVIRSGTDAQRTAAVTVLTEARRSLYLILAEDPTVLGEQAQPTDPPTDGDAS